jgi:hypothetical protein
MAVLRLRLSILAENHEHLRENTEQPLFILSMNGDSLVLRIYKLLKCKIINIKVIVLITNPE